MPCKRPPARAQQGLSGDQINTQSFLGLAAIQSHLVLSPASIIQAVFDNHHIRRIDMASFGNGRYPLEPGASREASP
jgi:hypothetical protein